MNSDSSTESRIRWLPGIAAACRVIVGLVFLTAGILKSLHPAGFAYQIETYGILSGSLSNVASIFFIFVEIVLGISLIINYRMKITVPAVGILVLTFMAANLWAWSQGKAEGCGCFGQFVNRTPAEVLVEDVLLLVGLGVAWFAGRNVKYGFPDWKRRVFLTSCLFAAVLPFLGPRLPVDSLVTDLKVGTHLGDLSVSDIDFDFNEGEYLVVLLGDDCSRCHEIVDKMNQLAEKDQVPKVVGILIGDRDRLVEFWWKYGATFALGHVPRAEVVNLYRTLPRMFFLKDGVVQRVWNDRLAIIEEFHKVGMWQKMISF